MSECDILQLLFESGLEGSAIVLLLVLSYKIYKVKVKTRSSCCGDSVNIETENEGVVHHEHEENV